MVIHYAQKMFDFGPQRHGFCPSMRYLHFFEASSEDFGNFYHGASMGASSRTAPPFS